MDSWETDLNINEMLIKPLPGKTATYCTIKQEACRPI